MSNVLDPTHVTDVEIERFCTRQLPAAALVVFADHIATCAACRQRLQVRADVGATEAALARELDDVADHLSESDVQAYVSRELNAARLREIERHLEVCPSCTAELRDLQTFVAGDQRTARSRRMLYAGLAAAAALIVAIALPSLLRRQDAPDPTAILQDQGGSVSVDAQGALSGVTGLSPAQRETIQRTLQTRRLTVPAVVSQLAGTPGTLLGDPEPTAFRLLSPVGTTVLDDRPTLRWTALGGSGTYVVTIHDETSGATTSSPSLPITEWTVTSPLTRGHTYVWQVAATAGGTEIVAPRPPAPPAMFAVLDAATASSLTQLPSSHFVRGVLYAQAGALDDAERELVALAARNPNSDLASTLLRELRTSRTTTATPR